MAASSRSAAFERFVSSMALNAERWRDGDPYDTDALAELDQNEKSDVVSLLSERLAGTGSDWRDVDALAALDTPVARARLVECSHHPYAVIRLRAAQRRAEAGDASPVEQELVSILNDPATDAPIELTMRYAQAHATPAVHNALLHCAVDGATSLRVHAAALSLYLAGVAAEPFDWTHRPLFLRFADEDRGARLAAREDLRVLLR